MTFIGNQITENHITKSTANIYRALKSLGGLPTSTILHFETEATERMNFFCINKTSIIRPQLSINL